MLPKIAITVPSPKFSVAGRAAHRILLLYAANPTEPDCSPDGTWIAFTVQAGDFSICIAPANGGMRSCSLQRRPLPGPNSRTLVSPALGFDGPVPLSLLDVFTKQVKNVPRIQGTTSQSQPAGSR